MAVYVSGKCICIYHPMTTYTSARLFVMIYLLNRKMYAKIRVFSVAGSTACTPTCLKSWFAVIRCIHLNGMSLHFNVFDMTYIGSIHLFGFLYTLRVASPTLPSPPTSLSSSSPTHTMFPTKVLTASQCPSTLFAICLLARLFELHVAIVCRSNIWAAWPIYLLLFWLAFCWTHKLTCTHLTLCINSFILIQICSSFSAP